MKRRFLQFFKRSKKRKQLYQPTAQLQTVCRDCLRKLGSHNDTNKEVCMAHHRFDPHCTN